MSPTIFPNPESAAGRLLSPQDAAFQLLEAAALAGYGSGGRSGLLPVLADGQPAYREEDVRAVANTLHTAMGTAGTPSANVPVGWRPHSEMTVDDLLRARAIAAVLKEGRMVKKLDAEISAIFATHGAIQSAMHSSVREGLHAHQ